jgi:murein DD-endopeptidase MepM/ murein hydrolase activator NlpD
MSAFTIDMSNPFPTGFTKQHGGPRSGGHRGPNWYIEFGMDLGAHPGTEVHAAFDAHITRFAPHVPAHDTSKVFGAQLFMRSPNDMMGGFYTHITDVPAGIRVGSTVRRGDVLGKVIRHDAPHLHLALVEIIGGAQSHGRYVGVNLFRHFLSTANSSRIMRVTFQQDGSAPTVAP